MHETLHHTKIEFRVQWCFKPQDKEIWMEHGTHDNLESARLVTAKGEDTQNLSWRVIRQITVCDEVRYVKGKSE